MADSKLRRYSDISMQFDDDIVNYEEVLVGGVRSSYSQTMTGDLKQVIEANTGATKSIADTSSFNDLVLVTDSIKSLIDSNLDPATDASYSTESSFNYLVPVTDATTSATDVSSNNSVLPFDVNNSSSSYLAFKSVDDVSGNYTQLSANDSDTSCSNRVPVYNANDNQVLSFVDGATNYYDNNTESCHYDNNMELAGYDNNVESASYDNNLRRVCLRCISLHL